MYSILLYHNHNDFSTVFCEFFRDLSHFFYSIFSRPRKVLPMPTSKPLFTGSCAALITPMTEKGIDFPALAALIRAQIDARAGAILLGGTTGEGSALTGEELCEMIALAHKIRVESSSPSLPNIAGVGGCDTASSCARAEAAARAGADALLTVTPPYVKSTPVGLARHYNAIARASALPILLYHVPSRTGQRLNEAFFDRIAADCPTVIGIKEASGDIECLSMLHARYRDRFALYCGSDAINYPSLLLGACGLISVLAVPRPDLTHALCEAVAKGNLSGALAIHEAALPMIRALFTDVNPVPVKTLMAKWGKCREIIRSPLSMGDAELKNRLSLVFGEG